MKRDVTRKKDKHKYMSLYSFRFKEQNSNGSSLFELESQDPTKQLH